MKKILLILLLIPFDLLYEIYYQWDFSKNLNKIHGSKFEKVFNSLSERASCDIHHIVHHNIIHRIKHLLTDLFLIGISFIFFYLCFSEFLLNYLHKRFIDFFLYFGKFMTITNMEMKIMELEQFIIVFFECKNFPSRFGYNKLISYPIFIFFLLFIFVPLIVRAKVFLEVKLKIISPIIIAICTILIIKAITIFIVFLESAFNFCKSISIGKHYPILAEFCKKNNISFDAYYYKNNNSVSPTLFCDFFTITKVMIYNDINLFTDREIEAALLFEAYKRTFIGVVGNVFLPFLPKIVLAVFMIYFSKKILEGHCNQHISHVTAFLIAEEVFSFCLEKFLCFPITILETYIDNLNYKFIKDNGFGEDFCRFLIISALNNHTESFKSSKFHDLFYKEKNLFEKIKRLL